MRIDRFRRAPGYHNQKSQPNVPPNFLMMWKHISSPTLIFLRALYSLCASSTLTSIHCFNAVKPFYFRKYNSTQSDKSLVYLDHTPVMRFRGGSSSDDEDDDCDSDSPGPSNHKRKRNLTASHSRSRKSAVKATDRISNTTEPGIQITLGNPSAQNPNKTGIYVDRVVNLDSAPEVWEVLDERVTYILDVSDTPGCFEFQHKVQTIDAMVKKQCQDSLSGPTGSKTKSLAQVIIPEDKDDWPMIMDSRRSNLSCGGFYTCSLADEDYLDSFEQCGTDSQDFVSAPIRTAKMAEAGSLVAIATEYLFCFITVFAQNTAEEHPKILTFRAVAMPSCANTPRWLKVPSDIKVSDTYYYRDPSMGSLNSVDAQIGQGMTQSFTEIEVDDDDVVLGPCLQIVHPSHLPKNRICPRTHFREGKHAPGTLIKQSCPAKLLILVPVEEGNMRAVIIPAAGRHHNHPLFPRRRVPFAAARQAQSEPLPFACTRQLLDGKMPQEIHPSLIDTRKRRQSVFNKKFQKFPYRTGLKAVWHEFELDRAREVGQCYIHAVNTLADDTHVIVTVNPELAALTLEASWIMLLVWLNGLDRRTVIGRVWSNRATREAFFLVWNVSTSRFFSKSSSLLGALGDSEGAQAQALGDVIILRRLNLKAVDGVATVDVDTILMFVWKTCLVHFKRGVFALETYMDSLEFHYLLSFPYLKTDADIQEYYTFCGESQNTKLKGSHAHDNQVNKTNATLLEAILSAREFDGENARIIKASLESGIWENRNNSLCARFSSQAAHHARSRQKKAEVNSDPATNGLRSCLKATEKSSKEKDLEIQRRNARLNDLSRPVASSSRKQIESFTPSCALVTEDWSSWSKSPKHSSITQNH
ncbi:hypothetical protein DFH08DRAFT_827925 [Mycena albidolilacea]|uniref:Uncharacterized protein n=1 Tax=Mycena albidolilacea TaxID=1033008 RepID=A0AAD6YX69_9AGAR|nr:hypothetical protein DFH08DRAFT_827925 [Mycena albidolilacea]